MKSSSPIRRLAAMRVVTTARQSPNFVAVLDVSSFTYAEATWTQSLPDWIAAHVHAFTAIDGVPKFLVPDNTKVPVIKACRYDPQVNRTYAEMADHYGAGILPALGLSQERLELGEGLLDRVEIGRVFRQEQEPGVALGQGLRRTRAFVDVQIVSANEVRRGDHLVAGFKAWGELCADIAVECGAINGSLDDPGGNKLMAAQARNEGLRSPLAEGSIGDEPLSLQVAPAQGRHVGLDARLVDEDQTPRLAAHERLAAVAPRPAGRLDVSAFFLRCQQRFFYR
jgi:hypothetical protein